MWLWFGLWVKALIKIYRDYVDSEHPQWWMLIRYWEPIRDTLQKEEEEKNCCNNIPPSGPIRHNLHDFSKTVLDGDRENVPSKGGRGLFYLMHLLTRNLTAIVDHCRCLQLVCWIPRWNVNQPERGIVPGTLLNTPRGQSIVVVLLNAADGNQPIYILWALLNLSRSCQCQSWVVMVRRLSFHLGSGVTCLSRSPMSIRGMTSPPERRNGENADFGRPPFLLWLVFTPWLSCKVEKLHLFENWWSQKNNLFSSLCQMTLWKWWWVQLYSLASDRKPLLLDRVTVDGLAAESKALLCKAMCMGIQTCKKPY